MRVRKFCCGCSLRTGVIILGIFDIICAVTYVASAFTKPPFITAVGIDTADSEIEQTFHEYMQVSMILNLVQGTFYVLRAFTFMFLIFMNFSVFWRKAYFIMRAVSLPVINTMVIVLNVTGCSFLKAVNHGEDCAYTYAPMGLSLVFHLLVEGYFLLVIYSFWKEKKRKSTSLLSPPAGYPDLHK